ncbi:NAD(P)H-dependent flavin oxidoreductase [Niveispirillum fermenti]|uniref:NAD(P)H-dependent flavin oxidoreductase n=1 Tax=Niveispirillum fermenti TaxID=1233113 RepID=UPI003A8A5ABA
MTEPLFSSLRVPAIAAPMFLVSGPDLVVAACEAGIVGSFPTPNCRTIDDLDHWMQDITTRLDRARASSPRAVGPWAANVVTHSSNARLGDELRLLEKYRPPIVITALGSPKPVMEVVKGYGGRVFADVINMRLAGKAVEAGVDGLVCVSAGAGGHTGYLSPFAFVSAVRSMFDGTIVVGGGISDGAGIAGAIAAGADLAYLGTRFIATRESLAADAYKQMIVDHGPDDLIVSDAVTGTPASWLRPSLIACGFDPDNMQKPAGERNYTSGAGSQKRWKDVWAAGQGLQSIKDVQPVAGIVDGLADQYEAACRRFQTFARGPA